MSNIWFISDLHFGQQSMLNFNNDARAKCLDIHPTSPFELADDVMLQRIYSKVTSKRDILYILGDNGNVETTMQLINEVAAFKVIYVPGNHDSIQHIQRLNSIRKVTLRGIHKYKGYWITHCPIHPREIWNKKNIHGHIHSRSLEDPNYINVSVEPARGYPISLEQIREGKYTTWNKNEHTS